MKAVRPRGKERRRIWKVFGQVRDGGWFEGRRVSIYGGARSGGFAAVGCAGRSEVARVVEQLGWSPPVQVIAAGCGAPIGAAVEVGGGGGSEALVSRSVDWGYVLFVLYLHLYYACLISVIRVIFTRFGLILWRTRISTACPVKRALVSPVKRALCIPRMVFVTPLWPEPSFGAPFLREFMPLGSLFFPIWYSDTLQETMFCKRIITVVDGFGPQSLVGDPVLVVYSLGVSCIFNGFVCLFHSTSLCRDLYVLLIELLSAVMDIVQLKD